MKFAAGPPSRWLVILSDGEAVDVWANSVAGLSGPDDTRDYLFECLMDIDPELQGEFEIGGRTPTNDHRVLVAVARFPRASVREITSSA
jgi:hypothetical protein